jgi:TP901 family phage tail tape measure protein
MESINQTMGFDASAAIASIGKLNKNFATMSTRLRAVDAAATKFNASGAELATVLSRIAPSGTSAAVAINRLYSAMSNASQIARATGNAADSLATKFTAANQSASALRGNLNNVAVAGGRAAAGLNKVGPGSLGAVAQQSTRAATAMDRLNASINAQRNPITPPPAPGTRGGSGGRLVVDPAIIGRVLQTQALLRGLGAVTEGFHFAASSAVEFSSKVAEIRTISTEKNLDTLKKQVADLANEFNRPLTDVAEGYYQTLSNQVGDAAQSTKFLGTALKFGKVAVTDTGDAVNLLAGALHAFNRPAEDAGAFAAKFFKTIELGRIRGSELASVYGRVATVAHQLGVTTDELDSSFATMTNKGVGASEAATQISGAMTALIKPSKAGAAALSQLGFESGEDAIKALTFQGALKALINTTDGSTSAIAKLVPRVRGLSFVLAATGEQAGFYKKSLEDIRAASEEGLNTEFLRQMSTDAEAVTTEVQRLSTNLTNVLGKSLLETANKSLKLVGGSDTLIGVMNRLIPLIEAAGVGAAGAGILYAASTLKTIAFAQATTALGRAFKFSAGWAGVALLAFEAYSLAAELSAKAQEKRLTELSDAEEKALDVVRKAAALRVKEQEDEASKVAAIAAQRNAALTRAYSDEIAQARENNNRLVADTKAGFSKLIQARESYLGQLRHKLDEQKRLEESVVERINDAKRQREDDQFEENLRGKTPHQAVKTHADAAIAAAEQAKTLRANPDATTADLKLADRKDSDAQRHLQAARSLHEREDSAVKRDSGKADSLAERVRHGQEVIDDAGDKQANHLRARLGKQEAKQLVQARAARKGQLGREDFGEENQEGNFAISQRRKSGRLAELRDKALNAGTKVDVERQESDADQGLLAAAAAKVRGSQDVGNAAQLGNVRQTEEQLQAAIKKTADENKRVADLTKTFHENVSQFDKKTGKPLPQDQQAERAAKARAAGSEILGLTLDSKDDGLNAKLASLQAEISKKLTDEEITNLRLAPEAIDGLQSQLQAALDKTKFELHAEIKFASDTGHTPVKNGVLDPEELSAGSKASTDRLAELEKQRAQIPATKAEISSYGRQAGDLASSAGYGGYRGDAATKWLNKNVFGKGGKSGDIYDQHDAFDKLRGDINRQAHGKSPIDIAGLEKRLKKLADPNEYGAAGELVATDQLLGNPGSFKQVQAAIDKLKAKVDAMDRLRKNEATGIIGQDEIVKLRQDAGARALGPTPDELDAVAKRKADEQKKAAKAAGDESASLNQSTAPAQRIAQLALWTANNFERAAKAIDRIRPPAAPDQLKDANDDFAAHGGTIRRFATGGGVGTDTIPAMLSPGEVVLNAQASRNFYPQLTALNAGSKPPASPSSNITNVGDINVTVPGGPTTAATARQLADMTRRELRRRA